MKREKVVAVVVVIVGEALFLLVGKFEVRLAFAQDWVSSDRKSTIGYPMKGFCSQ